MKIRKKALGLFWTALDRFWEYAACLSAAGVMPCYTGPDPEPQTRHTDLTIGRIYLDTSNNTADIIVGSINNHELTWVDLYRTYNGCADGERLYGTGQQQPTKGFIIEGYPLRIDPYDDDVVYLHNGQWYFETLAEVNVNPEEGEPEYVYLLMGGRANGRWKNNTNYPNRFLTLLSENPTQPDYVERGVNLDGNNGFIIDLLYQIAEDRPYNDRPIINLELFDANGYPEHPVIRVAVSHYVESNIEKTAITIEFDVDSNGEIPDEHKTTVSYERSGEDRWYKDYAPILRQISWYQLSLFVQRDPADQLFDISATSSLATLMAMGDPEDARIANATGGDLTPTMLRLRRGGNFSASTNLRVDDITVVKIDPPI